MSRLTGLLVAMWLSSAALVRAETVTARGTALAYACMTCHGPEGHSQGAIPSLAARPAPESAAILRAFRMDTRPSTVMQRIARGLDEADILAVAAYFAALPSR